MFKVFTFLVSLVSSLLFSSCSTVHFQGNATFDIASIVNSCDKYLNREVTLRATYMGWSCPPECKHPGLTRSDTCIEDETGCIYLLSTGKLDPIRDKGKEYTFTAVVKKAPNGVCYLKVIRVSKG